MPNIFKFTRFTIPLVVFVLLVIFFWKGLGSDPRKIPSPLVGKTIPHFNQADIDMGAPIISDKVFQGNISILNVWATWCLACHQEHDVLLNLSHKSGIRVYGLNYKDTRDAAKAWLEKLGNPFVATIFDPEGKLALQFGVYGTPETFLIDEKGVIQHKHVGPLDKEMWNKTFVPLINKIRAAA